MKIETLILWRNNFLKCQRIWSDLASMWDWMWAEFHQCTVLCSMSHHRQTFLFVEVLAARCSRTCTKPQHQKSPSTSSYTDLYIGIKHSCSTGGLDHFTCVWDVRVFFFLAKDKRPRVTRKDVELSTYLTTHVITSFTNDALLVETHHDQHQNIDCVLRKYKSNNMTTIYVYTTPENISLIKMTWWLIDDFTSWSSIWCMLIVPYILSLLHINSIRILILIQKPKPRNFLNCTEFGTKLWLFFFFETWIRELLRNCPTLKIEACSSRPSTCVLCMI